MMAQEEVGDLALIVSGAGRSKEKRARERNLV